LTESKQTQIIVRKNHKEKRNADATNRQMFASHC